MTGTIFLGRTARRKSSGARSRFGGVAILMGKPKARVPRGLGPRAWGRGL